MKLMLRFPCTCLEMGDPISEMVKAAGLESRLCRVS